MCVCMCVFACAFNLCKEKSQHKRRRDKTEKDKTIPSGSQELGYLWMLRFEIVLKVTISPILITFNVTDVL